MHKSETHCYEGFGVVLAQVERWDDAAGRPLLARAAALHVRAERRPRSRLAWATITILLGLSISVKLAEIDRNRQN